MRVGPASGECFNLGRFLRGVRTILQNNNTVIDQLKQSQAAVLREIEIIRRRVKALEGTRE